LRRKMNGASQQAVIVVFQLVKNQITQGHVI